MLIQLRSYVLPVQKCHTRLSVKDLYEVYRLWCELNGEKAVSKPSLTRKLQDKGFLAGRGSNS